MNKFKFYFFLLIASVSLFSCSKDDSSTTIEPPRDYKVQYTTDIALIEDYLKINYITVVNHPGFVDDQDITITKIPTGGIQPSIYSYLNANTYPKLLIRPVKLHDIEYKLYYLVLRPGVGISPCNVDGVLTSYRGTYLSLSAATATPPSELTATFFEESKYPQTPLSLYEVITGWSEIFPQFKTGTFKTNTDGTVTHNDFGAGVMFIPSGLAYFNSGSSIPAYSPLVFSFKLYNIERLDQDSDGVFSFQEDHNNDGYVYDFRNTIAYPTTPTTNLDDTDKDGFPDFLDVDDDGDNYTTRLEITKPAGTNSGLSLYFPFDPIVDDPMTTAIETETKGIPSYDKVAKTFDYTTPGRLRIHLDNTYSVKP
ncbi:FKBP-type peptidylprolyl isomerase [Flavobacterium franklandianum]|uniref:FKBP-type peptidyl-prolyl cis-trans isomerase n=1 Tax=Flavobacterium franklandianum TaxID=2594430 RepID=UPI00117BB951|nr:FKBP-type peptidylprolyl isomerase [Flavobacterium franklandianum]TRX21883.1 FKBP-type peptidylprolyl isomerase [Flavobacterium franklandianum]